MKRLVPSIILLCALVLIACSKGASPQTPSTYQEYKAPKPASSTAWVFDWPNEARTRMHAPIPEPIGILTKEQKANIVLWKAFRELPEETQFVILSTDIVLTVELERHEENGQVGPHIWHSTELRLRVNEVIDGKNLRPGQEVVVNILGEAPAKPVKGGRTVIFLRQTECDRYELAVMPEAKLDIGQIERLASEHKKLPLSEWAIGKYTKKEAKWCAKRKADPPAQQPRPKHGSIGKLGVTVGWSPKSSVIKLRRF